MSWGGGEFSGESAYDTTVFGGNVTYFAASGDTGGKTIYPGVSPNVVSAGGTSLKLVNGQWTETGWSGSGGGPASFESRPPFQNNISGIVGSQRGVPDFSFDADPNTGVAVYDSTRCQGLQGWMVFGGTSVSSPALAGIVNLAPGTTTDQNELTSGVRTATAARTAANFNDITAEPRAVSPRVAVGLRDRHRIKSRADRQVDRFTGPTFCRPPSSTTEVRLKPDTTYRKSG